MSMNIGGSNANVNAKQINFSDGTTQITASVTGPAGPIGPTGATGATGPAGPSNGKGGVAIFTGSNTSTVTFGSPYTTTLAPAICATALDGAVSGGLPSVQVLGTNGNWTGFTLTLQNSVFGAFSWVALPYSS